MFADIAFPLAIRRVFTYSVPKELFSHSLIGKRVWVPYRNYYAIGLIVRVHDEEPDFETKPIRKVLDDDPVLTSDLLKLTDWIHKFYFCSWGEVIQAALPSGLNFVSKTYVKVSETVESTLSSEEQNVVALIEEQAPVTQKEIQQQLRGTGLNKVFKQLLKKAALEVWEEPDVKVSTAKENWLEWYSDDSKKTAKDYLSDKKSLNKWEVGLSALLDVQLPDKELRLKSELGLTSYQLRKLKDDEWVRSIEKEKDVTDYDLTYNPEAIKQLNADQKVAFEQICDRIDDQKFGNFLLHGITGSGKTEVYIHALKKVIELGRTGLVLVPEIALTPQTVARFHMIFGDKIAVLHSRLSASERLYAWQQIEQGKKSIVIGPRSAVFAPVQKLGLIILDEEHDSSYKQVDPAPRYHAREVAIVRANHANAVVIMGSATPSMQALQMVKQNKAKLLLLKRRHAEAMLPKVEIINLTEYKGAMRGSMSVALYQAVEDSLKNNEQVILLYNRRGFANYMQCATCGYIPQSPECSVSLTYHKFKNVLMCHYSGYSRKADTNCEKCGSADLLIQGSGTQKIEEEIKELFPEAGILRFDRDSTSKKGAHKKILTQFADQKADILVGTQLVAKGLDFPNVTTVGVIDADTEQAFPAFNSSERLFQLLSQVAGRSGRGAKAGRVFIQTRQPQVSAIQFAKTHDFDSFAQEEMQFRSELNYPPFSRLITFIFKAKEEHLVIQQAHFMRTIIDKMLPDIEILGPGASVIGWMNQHFLWELSIKLDTDKGGNYIEAVLSRIMEVYDRESGVSRAKVRVNINVDAQR
ncbi:MAG: primosomal protein N' [Balneolaceae bacterium]|nr:primosomal protein N' [Balneolaceae bacterium]